MSTFRFLSFSNGTNTKYYSNSTRRNAEKEHEKRGASKTKTSNSFEFYLFWADANNRVIPDLIDFTKTFFRKAYDFEYPYEILHFYVRGYVDGYAPISDYGYGTNPQSH